VLAEALAAERANRPAYLHDQENTPHCYICGLCGALEELPDGRYRHLKLSACYDAMHYEIAVAWEQQPGGDADAAD
jgi:hypothetical protein